MTRIVFTGGGTGGHIFPGLAVVDELKSMSDADIAWIGSSRGIDREIVSGHGVRFYGIPSGKLRRYLDIRNLIDVFRIIAGCFCAFFLLLRLRPSVVFSKGGFVSVPPCFAAWLLHIPVITHECDFSPGLATRINSRFATRILVSYVDTRDAFDSKIKAKVTVTGNPVRGAFYAASAERGRAFLGCSDSELPIVMVQGGSLGARQVNDLVAGCVDRLCETCIVVHQTGSGNADQTTSSQNPIVRERYKPYPFIRAEMADVVAAADIVVSRSGANAIWECAAAGKPMILIPLEKGSSRGDQVENAAYFVSKGAAVMLSGKDATAEQLLDTATTLVRNETLRREMAGNSRALGAARPAVEIARIVLETSNKRAGVAR